MTDDEEEVPFVVLQPYAHHREIRLYPTSRIIRSNCGHLCWLSPQGEETASRAYTICVTCFDASYQMPDEEQVVVPGAVEALEELWGAEVADDVREEMRRRGIQEQ